jgi:hypothetical protein
LAGTRSLAGFRSELPLLLAGPQPWPKVSVVIPAFNEARNLPHVFAKLPQGRRRRGARDGPRVAVAGTGPTDAGHQGGRMSSRSYIRE